MNLYGKLSFLNNIYTYKTKGKAIEAQERIHQWINQNEDVLFENELKLMMKDFPEQKLTDTFIE